MRLNKTVIIILFVIFCNFNKTWGKGHGHGRGHGGSSISHSGSSISRSGSSISHSSSSTNMHSRHTSNSASRMNTLRKTWSSYSSDELVSTDNSKLTTVIPPVQDFFKYSPPTYSFNEYKPATYEHRAPAHYRSQNLLVNELDDFITGYITGKVGNKSPSDNDNSYLNYQYSRTYQTPIIMAQSLENSFKEKSKSKEDILSVKQAENHLRVKPFSINLNMAKSNTLKFHCQQQLHSEFNEHGEIVDSVKEICNTLTQVTTTPEPTISTSTSTTTAKTSESSFPSSAFKPYVGKEKRYERILASTPRGINCRKVMNSEFNERGEIVDSVTEICDPPTTTTTTTRKPTLKTTTRRPTTTPKPLVKVCRRVMDSYLNEAGEIIDSVTEVCNMEPIK